MRWHGTRRDRRPGAIAVSLSPREDSRDDQAGASTTAGVRRDGETESRRGGEDGGMVAGGGGDGVRETAAVTAHLFPRVYSVGPTLTPCNVIPIDW